MVVNVPFVPPSPGIFSGGSLRELTGRGNTAIEI
jgi:hypothetical protein